VKTKIVLVDDHRMMREGLRAILKSEQNMLIVGEAENGHDVLTMVGELSPDIIVMDVSMPDLNGIEAARLIRKSHPRVRVIALSAYADKRYILGAMEAGASGYILKTAACDELVRAIRTVMNGKTFLSAAISETAGLNTAMRRGKHAACKAFVALTPREREIIHLLAEGRTSAQIAAELYISIKTVEAHRRNISRKLDLHSVAELTKFALREGLTSL